ncbi:P-loop containing nucleoside triphosphate hydrolase protein [Microthyrium microscopicum]|uniref:P-loop containing nucleoside triphosphate hydrolase protein n=1 Tax=Microthyrium microscopicum TaxID=703497 RepID=A0A6A6ULZ6_9PEZI|nr:P-loop containing nucleoside triphosphate hydrolase protein [Microthyrium microscopicum]
MAPKIILILSGKGGVGKSSITTQLALSFCLAGSNVGVLDLDLTGPNIPRFLGCERSTVTQSAAGLVPVINGVSQEEVSIGALHVMSLAFMLPARSSAVIWRGPKKTAMVRQFLTQTAWPSDLDYLLVDTPPGTSDEHIAALETLLSTTQEGSAPGELAGAILVTTPQAIATEDVRKERSFCVKTGTRVLGVVENMAGFVCPHCAECTNVFSRGGGEVMAGEWGVKFLGRCPIDPAFGVLVEEGTRPVYPVGTGEGGKRVVEGDGLVEKYSSCELAVVLDGVRRGLMEEIGS